MLTELEKKIIASIQEDMPISERPYAAIAEKLDRGTGLSATSSSAPIGRTPAA